MRSRSAILTPESTGVSECLDRLAAQKQHTRPGSTYRLQLNKDFTFAQARAIVPYLHSLGVTHCYASPILAARAGSVHGYDIVDHGALNPEIGNEREFTALATELKAHNMGLVLDVVPNHMGIGVGTNPWWQDVLEHGPASEYARFFDIDWTPLRAELNGKVLLPILGDQYGEVLERGEIKLVYEEGRFAIQYFETHLPIDPQTMPLVFEPLHERAAEPVASDSSGIRELNEIVTELRNLPRRDETDRATERRLHATKLQAGLADLVRREPTARVALRSAIDLCNGHPGNPRSFDPLHRLLEAQAYRMAHWRVSAEEINYRRFFDINDLVGVRMEESRVFAETHRLLRRFLAEGCVTGVRVDHPDGLYNPAQYFVRLQMLYAASQCWGAAPKSDVNESGIEVAIEQAFGEHEWFADQPPLYVLAEKILEPGEDLASWPVDGTVGYDFLNLVNGVFIDARSRRAFTMLFRRFTGIVDDVATLIYNSKQLALNSAMSGELTVLTHLLEEISSMDRHARDFTRKALRDAIREVIASFPIYRTYVDARGNLAERDRSYILLAIARARRRNEAMPAAVFDFLRDVLLLRTVPHTPADSLRRRLQFTLKFQQLTGPVMAKGLEDTACYVYNRLVSVNDVGGSPDAFGISVEDFHHANAQRLERWPFSMLATATHDTKRGEDVRARINVLSEMPREWSAQVQRWRRANRAKKRVLSDGRSVPDANEEYLLYQTLVGTWPFHAPAAAEPEQTTHRRRAQAATPVSDPERDLYLARIQDYMTKAVHEAKVNLSWVNPNPEYVEALRDFVARVITSDAADRRGFLTQVEPFMPRVQFFGAINSLAQVLLKIASPGVPDFYQGSELWDLNLVDPDNRRPVDFALRRRLLSELEARSYGDVADLCGSLLKELHTGAAKLWTIMRALRLRAEQEDLFRSGSYTPLQCEREKQEHVIAFARSLNHAAVVVAVPRLAFTLMRGEQRMPLGDAWGAAEIPLPPQSPTEFDNVFTGERVAASGNRALLCSEVFARFPVALLTGH